MFPFSHASWTFATTQNGHYGYLPVSADNLQRLTDIAGRQDGGKHASRVKRYRETHAAADGEHVGACVRSGSSANSSLRRCCADAWRSGRAWRPRQLGSLPPGVRSLHPPLVRNRPIHPYIAAQHCRRLSESCSGNANILIAM